MTKIIGIIGGIGSGKSAVSATLVRLANAALFDADQIGHDILFDPEVKRLVKERWGDTVFSVSKEGQFEIDRKKLAAIVFSRSESGENRDIDYLNSLIHPRIHARFNELRAQCEKEQTPFLILDAPLLLETGWDSVCDVILFIDASESTRLQRVKNRNWDKNELARREKNQLSLQKKAEKSDYIIDNNGSYEKMIDEVQTVIDSINE